MTCQVAVNADRQLSLIARGTMTEPLPWHARASPWGGPVASPSAVVDLLYTDLLADLRRSMGPRVGLFGAIEIRFGAGPVYLHRSYRVSGEVIALSETPKTEVLWFDSRAMGEDGVLGHLRCQDLEVCSEFHCGLGCGRAGGGAVRGCQAAVGTRALAMWLAASWSRVSSAAASSGGALGRSGAMSGRRTWS